MIDTDDRLVWTDLETFGLNPDTDPIIEVGFRITDIDLVTIDEKSWLVWDSPTYDDRLAYLREKMARGDQGSRYVYEMHQKSGLWMTCQAHGLTPLAVEEEAVHWLSGHGVGADGIQKEPLCGSSVQFDRLMLDAQMPQVSSRFSYRNIDISSAKELCRRLNPDVYAKLETTVPAKKMHRVISDLDDTIAEANFYFQNFLFVSQVDHA